MANLPAIPMQSAPSNTAGTFKCLPSLQKVLQHRLGKLHCSLKSRCIVCNLEALARILLLLSVCARKIVSLLRVNSFILKWCWLRSDVYPETQVAYN